MSDLSIAAHASRARPGALTERSNISTNFEQRTANPCRDFPAGRKGLRFCVEAWLRISTQPLAFQTRDVDFVGFIKTIEHVHRLVRSLKNVTCAFTVIRVIQKTRLYIFIEAG